MSAGGRAGSLTGVAWTAVVAVLVSTAAVSTSLLTGTTPPAWVVTVSMLAWLALLAVYPSAALRPRWAAALGIACAAGILLGWPAAFIAGFAALAALQVWRFQSRSSVAERQAIKWLLLGLVPALGLFLGVGAVAALPGGPAWVLHHPVYTVLSVAGMWAVPVAAAVGLALGDRGPVDELVRWVVTAVSTTVLVALAHGIAQAVVPGWSTVVACASVLPASWLAHRMATRMAYSRGPQQPLRALPLLLAGTTGAEEVGPLVARTVRDALASPASLVRVGPHVLGSSGGTDLPLFEVPVLLHRDEVAVLAAAARPGETSLSRRDRDVLAAIAVVAAPALAGARSARAAAEAHHRAETARDRERDRLHADLGPALSGLSLTAAAISSRLASDDTVTAGRLVEELRGGIGHTATRVREIAYDLRPTIVEPARLAPLLRQRLGTEGPPAITLQVEPCDLTLPDAVQPDVVRVVLEAVTNVRRHADALHCTVQVTLDGEEVRVVVDDDGIGPGTTGSGIGLSSIAARTATFHGTSSLLARPGGGSRLTATFTTGTERHS